jgi:hypothetical protein
MMEKSPKTGSELEKMVLAKLRRLVASFNSGSSEREHCELALCKIVSRLRQRFDVSP